MRVVKKKPLGIQRQHARDSWFWGHQTSRREKTEYKHLWK